MASNLREGGCSGQRSWLAPRHTGHRRFPIGGALTTAQHREYQKPLRNQRPSWLAVAPATPRYLCKVRRLPFRKAIQYQQLTNSALNPRSPEVWRQTAGERESRVSTGASQCGGFRAKARRYWASAHARKPAENVGRGRAGGGRATGIQWSPNLVCPIFHMGVRLGSNSCIEKTAKFAPEKIGISLAHQV